MTKVTLHFIRCALRSARPAGGGTGETRPAGRAGARRDAGDARGSGGCRGEPYPASSVRGEIGADLAVVRIRGVEFRRLRCVAANTAFCGSFTECSYRSIFTEVFVCKTSDVLGLCGMKNYEFLCPVKKITTAKWSVNCNWGCQLVSGSEKK